MHTGNAYLPSAIGGTARNCKRVREALEWVDSVVDELNNANELFPNLESSLLKKLFAVNLSSKTRMMNPYPSCWSAFERHVQKGLTTIGGKSRSRVGMSGLESGIPNLRW